MTVLWWCLLGCPHPPPPPIPVEVSRTPLPEPTEVPRRPVDPGSYWTEAGGLCLEVPDGWSGTAGAPPALLRLVHNQTEVRFEVFVWSSPSRAPTCRRGGGCGSRTMTATAPYRSLACKHSHVGSGNPARPDPSTWSGSVGGRQVEVAATYPFGASVRGRDLVEPLLEALCTTYQ